MLYFLEKKVIRELVLRLREIKAVEKIVLFGSVARREHKPDSDIDIAVYLQNEVSHEVDKIAEEIYVKYYVPITIIKIVKGKIPIAMKPLLEKIEKEGVILWEKKKE